MYVNGYILGVPEEKKDAYVAASQVFAEVDKDFAGLAPRDIVDRLADVVRL